MGAYIYLGRGIERSEILRPRYIRVAIRSNSLGVNNMIREKQSSQVVIV